MNIKEAEALQTKDKAYIVSGHFHYSPHSEPSDVPRDIVVSAVDARSVQLTWAPPPLQHWNGIIIGYVIRVVGVHTEEDYHLPLTNGTSMVIKNLHPFSPSGSLLLLRLWQWVHSAILYHCRCQKLVSLDLVATVVVLVACCIQVEF